MSLSDLGNRICMLGPSNSGKSTLVNAIARKRGLDRLDQLFASAIGFVSQLISGLSVDQVVQLFAALEGGHLAKHDRHQMGRVRGRRRMRRDEHFRVAP